ncbi:MAG: arsenate reductase family protein [Thermoplasmata archaeon]
MSEPITAYVHKGCKTCKRATDYMKAHDIAFEPVELFDAALTPEELRSLLQMLSISAQELLRPRDRLYRELELKARDLPEEELIRLMAENPGLIKRPILVRGEQAVLGIRPERVHVIEP